MVISVGAYTLLWGWPFAALFVLLLFVHELGHALWLRKEGIPAGAPVFIPFVGAVIGMKGLPRNAYVEAKVGLAGPVLGTLGAAVMLAIGETHELRPACAPPPTRASCSTSSTCSRSCRSTAGARWPPCTRRSGSPASSAWPALLIVSPERDPDPDPDPGRPRGLDPLALAQRPGASASYFTVPTSRRVLIAIVYVGVAAACVLGMRAGYVNT